MTGAPDEWFALCVFVCPRCFADEHQFRVRIAHTKNGLRARAGEVLTLCADANAFLNCGEQFGFARRAVLASVWDKCRSLPINFWRNGLQA